MGEMIHVASLFLLASLGQVAAEPELDYPAMTNAKADDMAKTFAFCAGQQLSVEYVAENFPELKVAIVRAEQQFQLRFGPALRQIDSVMSRENTRWKQDKPALVKKLRVSTWATQVSLTDAKAFLAEVEQRSTGTLPSPFLETLLIYHPHFLRNPAEEFLRGYHKPMDLAGHEKSLGVSIRINVPSSWRIEEGNHPHIVGKATSENGRGNMIAMVLVFPLELPEDYVASEQEVAELFSTDAIREFLPSARNITAERVTLEELPAVMVEFEQTASRLGVEMAFRGKLYMVLFKNRIVQLQSWVSAPSADDSRNLAAEYKKGSPLLYLIGNSLVIKEKWTAHDP